ncbi:MAG: metalloregulator ArsR/SmtB family transcription factor [Deltaproteobacteria bacterium]|nr:metalloregulator ArsR/SmtB family transcription factor [Deltaproteobacteria bacterium]
MKNFVKVMKALSDPNRVKIIKMLQQKNNLCVCEMRAVLKLAQPTVSKHLKVLEDAELIVGSKEKLWVNYRLNTTSPSPYGAAMLKQLHQWLTEDSEIQKIFKILPAIDRNNICKS